MGERKGGGFGAKHGQEPIRWNLPILPLNVTSLKWFPLITFDDFRDPPPMSSFSKQILVDSPPPESLQSFQRTPFWVLSYDWSPLLFSQKVSDPP